LGYCSRSYNANGAIAISAVRLNRTYWEGWYNAGRKSELEQLMFHELGHCLLNKNHNDSTVAPADSGPGTPIPVSIMNSFHVSASYYEFNYTYYINEL
jgi:hypothetical protein